MYPIEFNNVSKKFTKGEKVYALRDSIPKLIKSIFTGKLNGNGNGHELKKEEFWAVRNVDFKVKKGEVLGIIGPNGAGKSTILKLLSKIMKPTHGELKVNGRLSALIEVTAGFHPEFTGRENIYFNGTVFGMSKKEIDSKYDEIVEFSGIQEFIDTPVKRYSSGMMARLGFAIAAHVHPDVLLVDEVLSVGDMTFQAKCTRKLRELLDSGVTIIFISHNIPLVQNLCDRIILLDKGQVLKDGSPEDVVPCYEDLVNQRREAELQEKLNRSNTKIRTKAEAPVKIKNIKLHDTSSHESDSFKFNEAITVKIDYEAKKKIEKPVFVLDVVREDGVLCFNPSIKGTDIGLDFIEGKGSVHVHFEETDLAPSVYFLRVGIWDEDRVHSYVINRGGIFKIEAGQILNKAVSGVYIPKVKWSANGKIVENISYPKEEKV